MGPRHEGLLFLPALLAAAPDAHAELRARALVAAAELGADHGEARYSSDWAEEALDLFRSVGDFYGEALAKWALASAQQNRGNLDRAARLLEACSERFQFDGRTVDVARAAYALGLVESQRGDYDRAEQAALRAQAAWAKVGSPCGHAKALWLLASVARYRGDLSAATALSEESMDRFAGISDAASVVHVRLTLADVARLSGDDDRATDLYQQALPELERIGDRRCTASTLKNIAALACRAGRHDDAVDLYAESISIRRDLGDEAGLAECLEGLAATHRASGRADEAVTLLGAAHTIREAYGVAASLPERTEVVAQLDALRADLDAETFTSAWDAGAQLSSDEAVARSCTSATAGEAVATHGAVSRAKMPVVPSLLTGLSKALVAGTIEADHEYERAAPHRTSLGRRGRGPWLGSLVLWTNGLRHVGDGATVAELERQARTLTTWAAWPAGGMPPSTPAPAGRRVVRLTDAGHRACEVWAPLPDLVEGRWRSRFGANVVDQLRAAVIVIASGQDADLPDGLPIVGYGQRSDVNVRLGGRPEPDAVARLALVELLGRVVLAWALDHERDHPVSLAVGANVLSALGGRETRIQDLPLATGIAPETVAVSLASLKRAGLAVVGTGPDRTATLTPSGRRAVDAHRERTVATASAWESRWPSPCRQIEESLGVILGNGARMAEGLVPPPNGWRSLAPYQARTKALLADPAGALPSFPIVTHRGGWPDGS